VRVHKSPELSKGLLLLSPSVSVCRGEAFYTDDRANGGRQRKVSHAGVVWDGQKDECCGIAGQRVHHVSTQRDLGEGMRRSLQLTYSGFLQVQLLTDRVYMHLNNWLSRTEIELSV